MVEPALVSTPAAGLPAAAPAPETGGPTAMLNDVTSTSPLLAARPVLDAAATGREGLGTARPPLAGLLRAGHTVNARVLGPDAQGAMLLSIAGHTVRVDAAAAAASAGGAPGLLAGQMLTLEVLAVPTPGNGPVMLRRADGAAPAAAPTPSAGRGAGPDPASQRAAVRHDLALALAEIGVTADEHNLAAAQALIRFGIAVTGENLADVRRARAARLVRLPEAVALAKSLGLPADSPAILRALDTLLGARADRSLLTVTVPLKPDTGAIAAHLRMAAEAATRSVEQKLLAGDIDAARADLRAHLLRAALGGGDPDAEAAARHLEGQMLVSASRASVGAEPGSAAPGPGGGDPAAVFVAFTVAAPGLPRRSHYVEMRVAPEDADPDAEPGGGNGDGVAATLRLPTAHLGTVTARLRVGADGRLRCRLSTPDAEGMRRIERSVGHLGDALERAGFPAAVARAERGGGAAPELAAHGTTAGGDAAAPEPAMLGPREAATRPLRALDLRV
jgi:hypothetical protein